MVGVPCRNILRRAGVLNGNAANMVARSRRPRRLRVPVKCTDDLARQIAQPRDAHARGKNKIVAFLRQRGADVSAATVGRMLARLLRDREVESIRAGKRNAPRHTGGRMPPSSPPRSTDSRRPGSV